MAGLTTLVVQLSESFADLWDHIGEDLGVEVRLTGDTGAYTVGPDVAAIILAAGGVEREALEWLDGHESPLAVPAIVVGADPGRRTAAQLVARGASDYFALPEDVEILRNAVASAVARHRGALQRAVGDEKAVKDQAFKHLIGDSPTFKAALVRAARILPHADATALIIGETGTGKELLARAIHDGGPRRGAAFVAVNCSALPAHLVESELFGHERGAYTDAHAAKPGLFEVAEGGTLFLDEIGTLAPDLQVKLLRVLDDKRVRRVGGTKSRQLNVRIIAATNENLEDSIKSGAFREDLYFRLSVITLSLPPLRDRGEDAVLVAQKFLPRLAKQHGLPVPKLGADLRHELLAHHWPGNVRELKNAVERALLLSPPGQLMVSELVPRSASRLPNNGPLPFPAHLDDINMAAAHATLVHCDGNRSEAARRLGISRRRLRRLLDLEGSRASSGGTVHLPLVQNDPGATAGNAPSLYNTTT
jgi:DNA-binding NtrC family response regulator